MGRRQRIRLIVDDGLTRQILSQLNAAEEAVIAKGSQPVVVVSAQLRRPFAAFLRTHGVSAIVMAVSELPDNRKVEIAASIGAQLPPAPAPAPDPDARGPNG